VFCHQDSREPLVKVLTNTGKRTRARLFLLCISIIIDQSPEGLMVVVVPHAWEAGRIYPFIVAMEQARLLEIPVHKKGLSVYFFAYSHNAAQIS
jgi:hypothetical protein